MAGASKPANRRSRFQGAVAFAVLSFVGFGAETAAGSAQRLPQGKALVGPGVYRPLYPASPAERTVPVERFWLDVRPVTNDEFLAFVTIQPEWRRDRVKRLFADEGYLSHWADAETYEPPVRGRQPVINVSWFAAKAYCAARGARLPTEREWELAASAGAASADGHSERGRSERLLAWYAEPAGARPLSDVGTRKPNFWGVYDLEGLVWEWVYDFGASLVSADSREKGKTDSLAFCGGAAADATDPSDYASFMRIAFRNSLEARYTTSRLGFRCARSLGGSP